MAPLCETDGIILGLDPGSYVTGYAVVQCSRERELRYRECGVLTAARRAPLFERIHELSLDLEGVIREFSPTVAVVEDVFSHAVHPRSALVLGQARGALICTLMRAGVRVVAISPAEVKRIVAGTGRASKEEVRRMAMALAGLEEEPPMDASDALAIALTYALLGERGDHLEKIQ